MIPLTRLNGKPFVLNALYIEHIEAIPDTMITLTSGKKYVVKEPVDEVVERVKSFYQELALLPATQISARQASEKQGGAED
ncbi:hypothetical protein BSNK01_20610 [Bacillaceae bacterium]